MIFCRLLRFCDQPTLIYFFRDVLKRAGTVPFPTHSFSRLGSWALRCAQVIPTDLYLVLVGNYSFSGFQCFLSKERTFQLPKDALHSVPGLQVSGVGMVIQLMAVNFRCWASLAAGQRGSGVCTSSSATQINSGKGRLRLQAQLLKTSAIDSALKQSQVPAKANNL